MNVIPLHLHILMDYHQQTKLQIVCKVLRERVGKLQLISYRFIRIIHKSIDIGKIPGSSKLLQKKKRFYLVTATILCPSKLEAIALSEPNHIPFRDYGLWEEFIPGYKLRTVKAVHPFGHLCGYNFKSSSTLQWRYKESFLPIICNKFGFYHSPVASSFIES